MEFEARPMTDIHIAAHEKSAGASGHGDWTGDVACPSAAPERVVVSPIKARLVMLGAKIRSKLRPIFLRFLMPLILLGPLLFGIEQIAEQFGFQGTWPQFMRSVIVIFYLVLILVIGTRHRRDK